MAAVVLSGYIAAMRAWRDYPFSAKIKTVGYAISIVSVVLLATVAWNSAKTNPVLALCLLAGAATSILGMSLRWWSYEIEEDEK